MGLEFRAQGLGYRARVFGLIGCVAGFWDSSFSMAFCRVPSRDQYAEACSGESQWWQSRGLCCTALSIIRVSIGDTLRVAIRVYVLGAGSLSL